MCVFAMPNFSYDRMINAYYRNDVQLELGDY